MSRTTPRCSVPICRAPTRSRNPSLAIDGTAPERQFRSVAERDQLVAVVRSEPDKQLFPDWVDRGDAPPGL